MPKTGLLLPPLLVLVLVLVQVLLLLPPPPPPLLLLLLFDVITLLNDGDGIGGCVRACVRACVRECARSFREMEGAKTQTVNLIWPRRIYVKLWPFFARACLSVCVRACSCTRKSFWAGRARAQTREIESESSQVTKITNAV